MPSDIQKAVDEQFPGWELVDPEATGTLIKIKHKDSSDDIRTVIYSEETKTITGTQR